MKLHRTLIAATLALGLTGLAMAQEKTLRLLTWADYAPADVVTQFEKESGYKVEVTLSNNEEMISKLRATGGAGFNLAQPSQDRITGPQQEFGIYKAMDVSKLKADLFIGSMLDATKKNTTLDAKVYGVPHIWGTEGLVVNTKLTKMSDYPDLCRADVKGKVYYTQTPPNECLGRATEGFGQFRPFRVQPGELIRPVTPAQRGGLLVGRRAGRQCHLLHAPQLGLHFLALVGAPSHPSSQ